MQAGVLSVAPFSNSTETSSILNQRALSSSIRTRLTKIDNKVAIDMADPKEDPDISSDDDDDKGKGVGKSRRELPSGAVSTLKAWLLSPDHFTHPYPTPQDQIMLMQKTGIDKKQLKNWFTNARRRIWKPMLKKQLEQGKLAATGAGGGGVAVPGVLPGLMVQMPGTVSAVALTGETEPQAVHAHFQQAVQQHCQPIQPQQQNQAAQQVSEQS